MRRLLIVALVSTTTLACSPAPAPAPAGRPPSALRTLAVQVTLGEYAAEPFTVRDVESGVAVAVSLLGARRVAGETRRDVTTYAGAMGPDAHVEHHARTDGTEDFVHFPTRPATEELRYRIDVGSAAGLRMVPGSRTLELLDATGTPRLRMAPPYGLAADGTRFSVDARVERCAFDEGPAPPWGRAPIPPRETSCDVVLSWVQARTSYPAMIDPAWVSTGSMAVPRFSHTATLLADGRVLVVGGSQTNGKTAAQTAEVYDPSTSTWATVGKLAETRDSHTAARLADGRAIVVGSLHGNLGGRTASTELYDPTQGTFSPGPSMAVARGQHAMAQTSTGALVVVGGVGPGSNNRVEILDPAAVAWTNAGVTVGRQAPVAVALADDRVLVAGGYADAGNTSAVELVDPKTVVTTAVGSLTQPRSSIVGARLDDGTVLLVGGYGNVGQPVADVARYTPLAGGIGTLTTELPIPGARAEHRVLRGSGGKLVMIGGGNAGMPTSDVQLFDPATSTWTTGGALLLAREAHTATVLMDGSLLVTGGVGGASQPLASAERCADGLCAKTPCSTKADCGTSEVCTGGFCVGLGPAGVACASGEACQSGICAQGVCCETKCEGPCISCNAKDKQGSPSGSCGAVSAGKNPSGTCTESGGVCGIPAACDGLGSCAEIAPYGKYCGQSSWTCQDGQLLVSGCDGKGTCAPIGLVQTCAPAKTCSGNNTCGANTCTSDAGCVDGFACQNGQCVGKLGTPCGNGIPCESGHCSGGICCDTACDGACEVCQGQSPGTCTPVPKKPIAGCKGPTCLCATPICDGVTGTAHLPDTTTPCDTEPACTADGSGIQIIHGVCSGTGACVTGAVTKVDCSPYACKPGAVVVCSENCASGLCAPGFDCHGTTCTPTSGVDAGTNDGGPSSDAGDDGGRPDAGDAGGCGCHATGGPRGSPLWLALALAAFSVRRRRR
jgi:MYXO-CTERM domain-containing protein